jgi:ankyrin repeat protein
MEVVAFLAEDPSLLNGKDHKNRTPLLLAAREGHIALVRLLLALVGEPS